jgi:excisionase family DNA binding protein
MSRRYVTQQWAAEYLGVTVRTIRNKISEGTLVGYRLPGLRAVRVDRDEIDSKMQAIPAVIKPVRQPFGPRAKIIVVEDEAAVDEDGGGT